MTPSVWFDPADVSGVFYFILALLVCGLAMRFAQSSHQCRQNPRAQTFHELPEEDVEEADRVELVELDEDTAKYRLDNKMRSDTLSVLMG